MTIHQIPSKELRLGDTFDFATPGGSVRVGTPTLASEAVPLSFLTALITANPPVEVVQVAGNVTIDGSAALPTIDGYAVQADDRVLLASQTDAKENGIWIAKAIGTAWARPTDFATGDSAAGEGVSVKQGTIDPDSVWICTADAPNDVVGTNNLTWRRYDVQAHILSKGPTGFHTSDDTYSTITWTDGSTTFSIAPAGSRFDVWVQGVRYTFTTAQEVVGDGTDFTIAEGLWYFYFDNTGALKASQTAWDLSQHAPVALIFWDDTNSKAIIVADERHGITMDWATHKYGHKTIGTRWDALNGGLGVTASIVGDGSADAHAQAAVADGNIFDEDLMIAITDSAAGGRFQQELSPTAEIPVYYRDGTTWRRKTANTFPVLEDGANRVKFNEDAGGGNWVQSNVAANGSYMAMWFFATNCYSEPVVAILGQREDTTISDAQENNDFGSLDLSSFPFTEAKVIWRLIAQTSTTYGNTVHARWRDSQDYRSVSPIPAGGSTITDHNTLTGRDTFPAHPVEALYTASVDTDQIIQPDGSGGLVLNTADIDNAVATDGAAAPSSTVMVGGLVESTVPTEETDGDLAAFWIDTFRRLTLRGYNLSNGSLDVTDEYPALMAKFGPVAWTQLTAPGQTVGYIVDQYANIMIAIDFASVDTTADVQAEGSFNNSDWFPIAAYDNSVTNWAISGAVGQASGDGIFALHLYPTAAKWVRLNFTAEAGGTAVTIDGTLYAGNGG